MKKNPSVSIILSLPVLLLILSVGISPGQTGVSEKLYLRTYALKINVTDLEKALSFYREKLGFEVEDKSDYPKTALFYTIVFETRNLAETIEELKRNKVKVVGKNGKAVVFEDPFGNISEIVQNSKTK